MMDSIKKRKIVQIDVEPGGVNALCDDGTLWFLNTFEPFEEWEWRQSYPLIPQYAAGRLPVPVKGPGWPNNE